MPKEDTLIEVLEEETEDYSDDSLYNINSWGADLSFRELISLYEDGDLLKPELQRKYVWDKSEASRFIDSILLGLPVPSIFLAKTDDEKMLIIDGYQRIMTVYDYVSGIFSQDKKVFQLTNSEKINTRWRGKAFSELSDSEQRKIRTTTIHCIIFVQLEPNDNDTGMYQIFERINTSGRTLMPQEIRNCVYQGSFNSLLLELNENQEWRMLYGLKDADSRMRDMEFILRFMALKSLDFDESKTKQISLKKYLNEFMGSKQSRDEKVLAARASEFMETANFVLANYGEQAFHNISYTDSRSINKFNPTIFDSIMISTANMLSKVQANNRPRDLPARRVELLQSSEYQDLIRIRTTNVERIKKRINMASMVLYEMPYE